MVEKSYVIEGKTYRTDGKTITMNDTSFILAMRGSAPFQFSVPTYRALLKIRKYYPNDIPADAPDL